MWKILYPLAVPKVFYRMSVLWLPWLRHATVFFLTLGFITGLFLAPSDYQQGDAFRIIYVHVPCAFLSMVLFAFMGFLGLLLLVWRIKMAGILLGASAEVGVLMAVLALLTGSIWGKPMWGAWWVWDARLTSELILLFLYAAILATRQAYQHNEKSDKLIAILALVGLVDLPVIHYSVYWWNTLHQGSTVLSFAKPKIHLSMLYPLLISMLGFALYCLTLILLKTQNELLSRERKQRWVKAVVEGV
jgi:heme exporter protein C